ncbi:MAG: hypothetical protein LBB22_02440 [Treponema sp.]|nr:hypothetical protein [Treponema sp.]
MKKTLFSTILIAIALAFALTGCPEPDSVVEVSPGMIGGASDIEALNTMLKDERFTEVWLFKDISLGNETLIIPPGKTLNLDTWTINIIDSSNSSNGTIVVAGDLTRDILNSKKIDMSANGRLIASSEFITAHVSTSTSAGDNNQIYVIVKDDRSNLVPVGETAADGVSAVLADPDNADIPVTITGTPTELYIIGNYNFPSGITYPTDVIVIGDVAATSTSNIAIAGTLTVMGKITNAVSATIDAYLKAQDGSFSSDVTFKKDTEFDGIAAFKTNTTIDSNSILTFKKVVGLSKLTIKDGASVIYSAGIGPYPKAPETDNIRSADDPGVKASGILSTAGAFTGIGDDTVLKFGANEFTVESGTLNLNGGIINLKSDYAASFILSKNAGISGSGSYLNGDSYRIGNTGGHGTLFSLYSDNGFTYNTIISVNHTKVASLTFSSNGTCLIINDGKTLDLKYLNIDLSASGTLSLGSASTLKLADSGSVTTGNKVENIAYDGFIIGGAGGSILVGTLDAETSNVVAGSISAGSLGTLSENRAFIIAGDYFAKVLDDTPATKLSGIGAVAKLDNTDGGSASLGGSILIFNAK